MSTIYLVELTGADAAGATTVFRYCTGNGYVTRPSDTPANTHYEGRVRQPGLFERTCHGGVKTFGLTIIGHGVMELENSDGALDGLLEYGLDGQSLVIKRGDDAAAYSTFTKIFDGTMDQPLLDAATLTVRIRDVLQNLDVPLQATKFAGSNSLPDGLEGTADDLKGKPKPIVLGYVFNWSPPQVNTSRRIFQIHYIGLRRYDTYDGEPPVVVASYEWSLTVYDQREALTAGSEKTLAQFGAGATTKAFTVDAATDVVTVTGHGYSTGAGVSVLADGAGTLPAGLANNLPYFVRSVTADTLTLHATKAGALANTGKIDITDAGSGTFTISDNRTALGCYDWCNDTTGGAYIRLGSEPTGRVTVDVFNPSTASGVAHLDNALMSVLVDIAAPNQVFNSGGHIDNAAAAEKVGIAIDQEMSALQAIGQVLNGTAYHVLGATGDSSFYGQISLGQLGYRSTTSFTFTEGDVLGIRRVASQDEDRGIPAWRVNVHYKKNYTVMQRDELAGSVTEADAAFCAQEWRTVSAADATVKDQYPNSPEINRYSMTTDATEAAAEATRVLAMYSTRRDIYSVTVSESLVANIELGQRVHLTHSRFGLSAGALFWILGITPDYKAGTVDLLLWK